MNKIVILLVICFTNLHTQYYAVVLKPVINVTGAPLKDRSYDQLPHAGGTTNPYIACPRLHQLLYNEQVEIIKESNNELCIIIPQIYCNMRHKDTPFKVWVNKKDVVPTTQLDQTVLTALVPPLSYNNKNATHPELITLAEPWHCKRCKSTFSAGTRFKKRSVSKNNSRSIPVYAIHPQSHKLMHLNIPVSYVITHNADRHETHQTYVNLLHSWAHKRGIIPYVWGGCSLVEPLPQGSFKEITVTTPDGIGTAFQYEHAKRFPIDGFDCSGLILRAAQAAGMPYFYKNSATLATHLRPVKKLNDLKDGDLIWIPAHVMAVGSINQNTLIEARHYSHGYGKVHEIPLHSLFKNIHTYADLFAAIQNRKPLYRLNSKGEVVQTIKEIKLLSIDSCWDNDH